MIYDLYAISNHYGGVGGGHYTAYGKNSLNGKWYSFNDSNCTQTNIERLVSAGAYNLFYRLRDHIDVNSINYEGLR